MIAEELIKVVRQLPRDERKPVVRSIMKSAGDGLEEVLLKHEKRLIGLGVEPLDALIEALSLTIHGPDGTRILQVIGTAGAREAEATGHAVRGKEKQLAKDFTRVLVRAERMPEEGLGWVATVVTAAIAVVSAAVKFIGAGIRKAKARRRALKNRLTPLTPAEIANIVQTAAPRFPNFAAAQPVILEMINGLKGRSSYLLDPATGSSAGSRVNEFRDMRRAFNELRLQINMQVAADKQRKLLVAGGIALLGTGAAIGAASYLTR